MKINRCHRFLALLAAVPLSAVAGEPDADISMYKPTPPPAYEAGRGLITLEGPSGMFINPTSATIPKGYSTIQYCMFLPNQNTDVIGNGFYGAFGITDWFEVGAIGKYIDTPSGGNPGGAGPSRGCA